MQSAPSTPLGNVKAMLSQKARMKYAGVISRHKRLLVSCRSCLGQLGHTILAVLQMPDSTRTVCMGSYDLVDLYRPQCRLVFRSVCIEDDRGHDEGS